MAPRRVPLRSLRLLATLFAGLQLVDQVLQALGQGLALDIVEGLSQHAAYTGLQGAVQRRAFVTRALTLRGLLHLRSVFFCGLLRWLDRRHAVRWLGIGRTLWSLGGRGHLLPTFAAGPLCCHPPALSSVRSPTTPCDERCSRPVEPTCSASVTSLANGWVEGQALFFDVRGRSPRATHVHRVSAWAGRARGVEDQLAIG